MRSILICACIFFSLGCPGSGSVIDETGDGGPGDSGGSDVDGGVVGRRDGLGLPEGAALDAPADAIDAAADRRIDLGPDQLNQPAGKPCSEIAECNPGLNCFDGVCCDGTCMHPDPKMAGCWRCNLPGRLGRCTYDQPSCTIDAGIN